MQNQKKIDEDLFEACKRKDLNQAKTFISCGADPCKVITGKICAAIHWASYYDDDDTDILEAITLSGRVTDIDVKGGPYAGSALSWASYKGNIKCARILVDNGANVNSKNKNGNSVIHRAVNSGNTAMVSECLKWNGIDVNQRGNKNKTALILACEKGFADVVGVLLAAGADTELRDDYGTPAVWYVKNNQEITNMLVKQVKKHVENKSFVPQLPSAPPKIEMNQIKTPRLSASYYKEKIEVPVQKSILEPKIPIEFSKLQVSPSINNSKNQNMNFIKNIIRRVLPKFQEQKVQSVIDEIENTGFDFDEFNRQQLLLLEPDDFGEVLKRLEARILLKAFKEEFGMEGKNSLTSF